MVICPRHAGLRSMWLRFSYYYLTKIKQFHFLFKCIYIMLILNLKDYEGKLFYQLFNYY